MKAGQIREIDEPFKIEGKKAMYPGALGILPKIVIAAAGFYNVLNELVRVDAKTYNDFKESANALNNSLDHRMVNYTVTDYSIKTGALKEFISTAVERYFADLGEVRKRNRMIYDLVDEVLRDEQ